MTTYAVGGALSSEASTYIKRQADRDLAMYLQAGKFCYILNSRQMGKSSLKLRTMQQLQAEGVICAEIDLTGMGTEGISEEQWYYSIADELATQFDLESNLEAFWDNHNQFSCNQRLAKFIDEVLEQLNSRIVIFIDEIDQVLSLDFFTDNFFGLIRSCAERQASRSKYQLLSFVLIGVAVPTDLIKNKQRTPLNIGQAIELHGFQLTDDLSPLINGLVNRSDPRATIKEILDWTGGQPFLTQKVCRLVVESSDDVTIQEIVQRNIIDNWEYQDNPVHLKTISNRLLGNTEKSSYLLEQYRQIISSDFALKTDSSREQQDLRLSGLVVDRGGKLQVYNRIYQQIFNRDWIDQELSKLCPHSSTLLNWIDQGKSKNLLLSGQALRAALRWRDNRAQILSRDHSDFLDRSQKVKYTRDLVIVAVSLFFGGVASLSVISWRSWKIIEFDRRSNQIMKQSEFAPLDALHDAINNAKDFQDFQPFLLKESLTTPELALQKLVDSVQEVNEINTYQQGINVVYPCRDGRIFTAGSDGSIKLWTHSNDKSSKNLSVLNEGIKINSLTWENDSCQGSFASGHDDGHIRIWKLNKENKAEEIIAIRKAHQGGVQNVRLLRDQDKKLYLFSTGKTDGFLKKWKIDARNKPVLAPKTPEINVYAHSKGIIALNINGEKNQIGTAGKDETAKIWNLDGKLIKKLKGHRLDVNSIFFCSTTLKPKQEKKVCQYEIATGSSDGTVQVWNARGENPKIINAHVGEVRAVRFSPDGQLLATGSANDPTSSDGSSARIWDLQNLKLITEFKGHHGAIESMRFNSDEQLVTSGQDDSVIRIWKIPELIDWKGHHQDQINSVRFNPKNSSNFITAGDKGAILWWEHSPGKVPKILDRYYCKEINFQTIRFHPDLGENMIAVGDSVGIIRFLKIKDGKIIKIGGSFDTQQKKIESMDWNYKPYNNQANQYLLATTGMESDDIKVWKIDTEKYKLVGKEPIYKNDWKISNLTVRFSPDGNNLVIGAKDAKVFLLQNINGSVEKISVEKPETEDTGSRMAVGFSRDSQFLTIFSIAEGKIWRLKMEPKLKKVVPILTSQTGTENIAISDDNKIATGGAGATVRTWDDQGRQLADFRGSWGAFKSISFSEDGKYIVAGGKNGIPKVWQIKRSLSTLIKEACELIEDSYSKKPDSCRSQTNQLKH
jgi:WD40 repeat protein